MTSNYLPTGVKCHLVFFPIRLILEKIQDGANWKIIRGHRIGL